MSGENILKYLVLLFCIIHRINSIELKCEYKNVGTLYFCNVKNNPFIENRNTKVEIKDKLHQGSQKNENVTGFKIVDKTMKYFPIGLNDIFPDLQEIHIENTGLVEINLKDLAHFPNLKKIFIIKNLIEEIPKDLFKFNLKLNEIKFWNNTNLRYIHPKVFGNLQELATVNMHDNGFNGITITTREKVQSDLVRDIKKCCMKEEYRMELFVEEMNETLSELQKNITLLSEKIPSLQNQADIFKSTLKNVTKDQASIKEQVEESRNKIQTNLKDTIKNNEEITKLIEEFNTTRGEWEEIINKILLEKDNQTLSTTTEAQSISDGPQNDKFTLEDDILAGLSLKDCIYLAICSIQTIFIFILFIISCRIYQNQQIPEKSFANRREDPIYSDPSGNYQEFTLPHEKSTYNLADYQQTGIDAYGPVIDCRDDFQYESVGINHSLHTLNIKESYESPDYEEIGIQAHGDNIETPIYSEVNLEKKKNRTLKI